MTAAETLGNTSTGTYVFLLLLALAWALWPLAILTNFKGYRERHARRSLRTSDQIGRLPPYRWWQSDPESDRKFTTAMQFTVAVVFLLVAVTLAVIALVGVVRGLAGG